MWRSWRPRRSSRGDLPPTHTLWLLIRVDGAKGYILDRFDSEVVGTGVDVCIVRLHSTRIPLHPPSLGQSGQSCSCGSRTIVVPRPAHSYHLAST